MLEIKDQPSIAFNPAANHPLEWLAPEEVLSNISSRASDVYSFGVTMLEALLGKEAFDLCLAQKSNVKNVEELVKTTNGNFAFHQFSDYCTKNNLKVEPALEKLLSQCLQDDPNKRPTMNQVVHALENVSQMALLA